MDEHRVIQAGECRPVHGQQPSGPTSIASVFIQNLAGSIGA